MPVKVGNKYDFYDGAGIWGTWVVEILEITEGFDGKGPTQVVYRQTNEKTADKIVYSAKLNDVENYISNGDWELKR